MKCKLIKYHVFIQMDTGCGRTLTLQGEQRKPVKMCLYNIICKCRCTLEEHEEHSWRKVWAGEEELLQLHFQTLLRVEH